MAFVTLPGQGAVSYPAIPYGGVPTLTFNATSLIIDAAGERIALMGQFWSPDGGSKTINTVSFLPGTVVNSNGSTVRVSLQNLSTTLSPCQPDGTQDQFRDTAIASITSNTWFTTGLVTNDGTNGGVKRTVNQGDFIAVVIEFQTFVASDIIRVQGATPFTSNFGPISSLFTGTWASQNVMPDVVFTCSDATIATFSGAYPGVSYTTVTYNSGSSPDEYGIRFTPPVTMRIDGFTGIFYSNVTTASFEAVLYQDTTVLETIVVPAALMYGASSIRASVLKLATKRTLTAGVQYILALKPTTVNSLQTVFYNTAATNHIGLWPGGVGTELMSRTDLGAWAVDGTPTRRWFHLGVTVTDIDIPSGGGGGGAGVGMTAVLC